MPTNQPNDVELDPLETADQEELADDSAPTATSDDDIQPVVADPDAEIVAEIEKVGIEEEAPKPKPHMIPRDLIDRELTPEDLWDEGTI